MWARILVAGCAGFASVAALDNGLGRLPPLGWSGFNYFGFALNETIMLDTAAAMVSTGLAKLGFEYVNLDAGWLDSARDPSTSALVPVKSKWPHGMKYLADNFHAKGLKLGVYTDLSDHTCGWGPGSYHHFEVDANTFAAWGVDYLKVDFCGAVSGPWQFPTFENSCASGALGAGGDMYKANTTIAHAIKTCQADPACGGFTTATKAATACASGTARNTTIHEVWFKDQTSRSNGNPTWSLWQKPGVGRIDYHARPQYKAWAALGEALNKSGRPIYYSICPHTNASTRGTALNYSYPTYHNPIYAPPLSWTAGQRHKLANSLLVEYQNTIDDWYKPEVDKKGGGDWGILTNIDSMVEATHFNYSVPGSWNDADMMTVCMYGKGAIPGQGQTLSEYRAQYSVWAIMASPMLHGADLRTVAKEHPDCFDLMLNGEIIKVNQDKAAQPVRLVYQHPPFPTATTGQILEQIFARPLSGGRTAVLLFNRGPSARKMSVSWKQLGFDPAHRIRVFDVIAQTPVAGTITGAYTAVVSTHDVGFVILS